MTEQFLGLDAEVSDGLAAEEVVLNDALEAFRSAGVIPDGIGIDDSDGAAGANAEAVGLCAMDESLRAAELELGEAFFKKLPGGHAFIEGAALGLGGGGTEQDVLLIAVEVEGFSCGF